jgi:hypothetical protein
MEGRAMRSIKKIFLFACLLILLSSCAQAPVDPAPPAPVMDDAEGSSDPALPAETQPDRSGDLIPDGVLISTTTEESLTLVDIDGRFVREIETPGITNLRPEEVTIAGPLVPDGPFPPVIYRSWMPDQALMVNDNGQVSAARTSDTFLALAGAPGQAAFAFSEVKYNENNYPHGFLYAAKTDNLSSVPAFFDLVEEPSYWPLKPVGVETTAGEPQGVWYVKTAWGIGGVDLIFPINRGLYFFDLTSGDNLQILNDNHSLQGISPDLGFAASVDAGSASEGALSVTNLSNQQTQQFPLDPATDRGAGWAVFSPDNRYAAWLEASGSMISDPYDFHPRVRVGDISNGGVVQSVEDTAVNQVIGGNSLSMQQPVGWLDNETLLIEVRAQDWNDARLLRFDVNTGNLTMFSDGAFLAFAYQ